MVINRKPLCGFFTLNQNLYAYRNPNPINKIDQKVMLKSNLILSLVEGFFVHIYFHFGITLH